MGDFNYPIALCLVQLRYPLDLLSIRFSLSDDPTEKEGYSSSPVVIAGDSKHTVVILLAVGLEIFR